MKKGIIAPVIILLGLLLLIGLGIGSYYYFKSQQIKPSTPVVQQNPSNTASQNLQVPVKQSTSDKNTTAYINIYMIDVNNMRGSTDVIGCGDSVVAASTSSIVTNDVEANIKMALNDLFSITDSEFGKGGMYDSLYQSKLAVASVTVTDGVAVVKITGQKLLGGECDDLRFVAQIERTVTQFPEVKSSQILVNDGPLNTSLK